MYETSGPSARGGETTEIGRHYWWNYWKKDIKPTLCFHVANGKQSWPKWWRLHKINKYREPVLYCCVIITHKAITVSITQVKFITMYIHQYRECTRDLEIPDHVFFSAVDTNWIKCRLRIFNFFVHHLGKYLPGSEVWTFKKSDYYIYGLKPTVSLIVVRMRYELIRDIFNSSVLFLIQHFWNFPTVGRIKEYHIS